MRYWPALLLGALVATQAGSSPAPGMTPIIGEERIILSTNLGDLVLALYPEVAPRHVDQLLRLVRAGAYDTTRVVRVEPGFVIQFSDIHDREVPLTQEQRAVEQDLPAEFSSSLHHELGTLSMARWDDPNSARSSFSILLGEAPHLNGAYTIFGHLESGGSVLQKIVDAPRTGAVPSQRITVIKAHLGGGVTDRSQVQIDPVIPLTYSKTAELNTEPFTAAHASAIFIVGIITILGILGHLFSSTISKEQLRSLVLLITFISGFCFFTLFFPLAQGHPWYSPALLFGMIGIFKLMSEFEVR